MTLAVVSHDAGGAEVLSSYVRKMGITTLLVLDGPARAIFARKLGSIELSSLEDAIARSSQVLCGTSWQSNLEFDAIGLARESSKHCVAFVDHWVNYAERFIRSGKMNHPDEIWVGDSIAERMARRQFAPLPVRLIANPYFEDIRLELAGIERRRNSGVAGLAVLYVCEPISEHALVRFGNKRHFGYFEDEAMRFFLGNVACLGASVDRICIRPHPSEAVDKYDWVKRESNLPIEMGGQRSLVEEVADCDIVVGCESMAMVVGLLAGKRVISCIPPGGKPCGLPHPQIERLQLLATARSGETSESVRVLASPHSSEPI